MPTTQVLSDEMIQTADATAFGDYLDDILALTEEIFPGEVRIDVEADPEWPQDRYVVFTVKADGDARELVQRQCEWHRRVLAVAPDSLNLLRLSIVAYDRQNDR